MAHAAGALVLIDGAQAVPHIPVDVQELGCDFYAFSGHKMLAPMGSGALWARRELLDAMPPFLAGGEMIREVHLRRSDFNDVPWKFEAGTPAVADAIGLGVAADYLRAIGMDAVREHEKELLTYALITLPREVPEIELYGPMDAGIRGGVIPFNLPGIHPHDVAQVLDRFGIAVRAGHHCTMPLHERLDLPATARASFSVYTTRADIDALASGLRRGPARLQRLTRVTRRPSFAGSQPSRTPWAAARPGPPRSSRRRRLVRVRIEMAAATPAPWPLTVQHIMFRVDACETLSPPIERPATIRLVIALRHERPVGHLEIATRRGQDQDPVAVDELGEDADRILEPALLADVLAGQVVERLDLPGVADPDASSRSSGAWRPRSPA